MKLTNLKINGIRNPLGYLMDSIRLSCVVKDASGKEAAWVKAEVSTREDFADVVHMTEGKLDTAGIPLDFETAPRTRYFIRITVTDEADDTASEGTWFETSKQEEPWDAKWLTLQEEDTYHPVFEKKFTSQKDVVRARLYISGLGMYAADLNGRKIGEEILTPNYVDISVAMQGPKGLMVPVIRDVHSKGLAAIEGDMKSLADKVRSGKVSLEEMSGGTFTLTNGGVFGSMLSTPLINPPQSAILGMHNIVERPVAITGKVEIRPMMYLALSYDHRLIDGKDSVGFLVDVKKRIEDPLALLTGDREPGAVLLDV